MEETAQIMIYRRYVTGITEKVCVMGSDFGHLSNSFKENLTVIGMYHLSKN